MYLILTSKEGEFRTEPIDDGLLPVEAYDYLFYGRKKATFVIAECLQASKIRVTDNSLPPSINDIPTKFFEKFDTLEKAREELRRLARFGSMDITLVPCPLP